jgi:spore germination cell wall hydrolase CwlJ-like protein
MRSTHFLLGVFLTLILSAVFIATAASANLFEPKIIKVDYEQLTPEARKQIDCLAENIYHEARSEPVDGQIAVALVTLNRVNDERFPKDICGVVKEKGRNMTTGRIVCQFSWYCMPVRLNKNSHYYQEAVRYALHVYANYELIEDFTRGSLFYHADYVSKGKLGVRGIEKSTKIGRHIFYIENR